MQKKYWFLFGVLILCFGSLGASNYGKIGGVVLDDKTGEPLPGVNVIVEELNIGAATDEDGYYMIIQVKPGNYRVVAEFIGYRSVKIENVTVRANRTAHADFQMKETMLEMEAIIVIADRPVVERDNTATARSVSSEAIDLMPVNTVNEILSTQPGVVNSGGMHFRGGRSGEVVYYIDGIPVVNPLTSEINSSEIINQNTISEMQVISGTYSAEYGNAMSGIINITTKEGGNKTNFNLDVRSSRAGVEENSSDYNRKVMRGSLSGPLPGLANKTNYFLSVNYDDRDNYLPWGYNEEKNLFAKITDNHIKNLKLFASINFSDGVHKSYTHSYKYIPDQYWYKPRTDAQLFQLGLTHTLAKNVFYNLNLYYNKNHYDSGDFDYNDLTPDYRRDENNEFYLLDYVSTYEEDDQTTTGLKGDILWQANVHNEVKAGFELKQHEIERFYINAPYYDDHILDEYTQKPIEAAAFIQDKINFSNIILSAGLRFDYTDANASYWDSPFDAYNGLTSRIKSSETHTQLSPRLGISYPISTKTVFHFGYGHYFQRPDYQFIYKTLSRDNSVGVYDADGDGDVDYTDNIIMNLLSGNGRYGSPNLKPEKTVAYEFGVSHQLFKDYVLNVSVYSKNITNLLGARTFFAGDTSATGDSYFETFTKHINEDFAYNNGVELQLQKRTGSNWLGEINYTYSVAKGSSSGPLERVGSEDANRQSLKFFPLEFDQRHTINGNLTFRLNKDQGFKIGSMHPLENARATVLFSYGSGLPYTKGIRGATEAYEINNRRLPATHNIDLKIDKKIAFKAVTLSPYLEIRNLFDRKNVLYVDPDTGKPDYSFGRTREYANNPLNYGAPRIIYLGTRLQFN